MFAACVRSTSGPGLTCASCESTAPNTGSTTSLAWQHGQVTFRFSPSFSPMATFYANCGTTDIPGLNLWNLLTYAACQEDWPPSPSHSRDESESLHAAV